MSDNQGNDEVGSVLRPFEEAAPVPLPPVEPSKIVPEDRAPQVPDEITPDAVVNAPGAPPIEGEVPDIWSAGPEPAAADEDPDIEDIWAAVEAADDPVLDEAATPQDSAPEDSAPEDSAPEATVRAEDADPIDAPPPVSNTVTLPRKPFLIGLGAVGVAIVVLLALWQTAGGDDAPVVFAGEEPAEDPPATSAPAADDPIDETTPPVDDGSAELQSEIDGLTAQIDVLEDELADIPPPSLAGDQIHRIPVVSGSKFVSATDVSVAVVSPFGGYANINPATDTVTASGTVSGGATRVMRTDSSVWVTDYSGNQLVRIDPQANTVDLAYPFPGPDGLAKWNDRLVVASFDEGFLGIVNPGTGEIIDQIDLGGKPTDVIVTEDHGAWVALFDTGELVRVNIRGREVVERVLVGAGPVSIAASDIGLWVANHNEGTVALVDTDAATVAQTIEVGEGPTGVIAWRGDIWVTVTDAGDLVQIDKETGEILTRTSLGGPGIGGGPVGIDRGAGSLWVAMDGEASVVRITKGD